MANENEASVEEILESIKKVIARDGREVVASPSKRTSADQEPNSLEAHRDDVSDEVLDLADMELGDAIGFENETDPPLVSEDARGAMQENLAALAMLSEPGAKPKIVRSGETSLEGLAREMLKPMLAEWLDNNLPGMVEKMVQAEIARIAGKRG